MKICIISTAAPRHMSMYSIYVNYFKKRNIPFDLIYLDRFDGTDLVESEHTYRFKIDNKSRISRYAGYLNFSQFVKSIMKKNEYDYLIIWNELTASLLSNLLAHNYVKRYCINIRDLFDENNIITKLFLEKALNKSIMNADFNTISSDRYVEYLPSNVKYIMFHSINENYDVKPKVPRKNVDDQPINIMYIGNIRFLDKAKSFIDLFKNDNRFIITFAGNGSQIIKQYCEKIQCINARFIGSFQNEKTSEIVSQADILYNLYGTESAVLKTALSQKLYLAVSMRMPILVNYGTYMFDIAKECGIAFGIKDAPVLDKAIPDKLYDWYLSLDYQNIDSLCREKEITFKNSHEVLLDRLNEVIVNIRE